MADCNHEIPAVRSPVTGKTKVGAKILFPYPVWRPCCLPIWVKHAKTSHTAHEKRKARRKAGEPTNFTSTELWPTTSGTLSRLVRLGFTSTCVPFRVA
jgi:hypothetical protein